MKAIETENQAHSKCLFYTSVCSCVLFEFILLLFCGLSTVVLWVTVWGTIQWVQSIEPQAKVVFGNY